MNMKIDPAPKAHDGPACLGRHREMLGAAILAVTIALLLEVRPDERVALRALPDYPLPHVCATRAWLDLDCPGCGLTRSMIHLARGDWDAATRAHRLGPLIAAALLVQIPYRLYGLQRRLPERLGQLVPRLLGSVLIAALIGNWLYNQLPPGHSEGSALEATRRVSKGVRDVPAPTH
jgi:hypothetical protein